MRLLSALLGVVCCSLAAAAETPSSHPFNLPADDAAVSLKLFVQQSGEEVIYPPDEVRGTRTNAVQGDFTSRAALDRLLAGTDLVVTESKNGVLAVNRAQRPNVDRTAPLLVSGDRPPINLASDTIRLDPFAVVTSKDTSYGALNSNSITRFNTELNKVPISADIFTSDFMTDVDALTVNDMLTEYGAGMGVELTNASGAAFNLPGDAPSTVALGVRGLSAGNILRDGFNVEAANGRNDGGADVINNFDIERVEVLRGPQGLLYGGSGAGGTITATTKEARFDDTFGSVFSRVDQYGSKRNQVDFNTGEGNFAFRFAAVSDDQQYERLFLFAKDRGYYGEAAVKLPLNTTLRVNAEYFIDDRSTSDSSISVALPSTDPRNGDNLQALLFNGDAGAINPATGQAWSSVGAIDNGLVNWQNVSSFAGYRNEAVTDNRNFEVVADTVWSESFSTEIAGNFNGSTNENNQSSSSLSAPGANGNPLGVWAMATNMNDAANFNRHLAGRAAGLYSRDFFNGRVKTQTSLGGDIERQGFGTQAFSYYQATSSGALINNGSPSNFGRVAAGNQWWSVANGPVFHPSFLPAMATPLWYSAQDGTWYVRQERDPRSPAWVTPTNPEGLGQLYPPVDSGVSGNDLPDYQNQYTIEGLYFANETNWGWDDLNSLVGYRRTETANHVPNVSSTAATALPFDNSVRLANSFNVGLDGRILEWLRWYGSVSSNYNNPVIQATDPYGNPPLESRGVGEEVGLKFTPLGSLISGSLDAYSNQSKDDDSNQISILNNINPVGLNGQYQGEFGAGTAVPVNYVSRGLELILTANPTHNWRIRFAATTEDGKVETTKTYGLLYNDQFYTDGKGDVTYANGQPFLVPVAPGTNVSSLSTSVNPATILSGVPTEQLTTAMIGDSTSPWYAWQGNQVSVAGNIASTSNVGRALKNFNVPGVGTALTGATGLPISQLQYAWPDPNNTHGVFVASQAGTYTVGYPVFRINLTNSYQISEGWAKGLGATVSLNDAWNFRTFYYATPSTTQLQLWQEPELGWQINLNPYYVHKFKRVTWRTQLNISNLTNHYVLVQPPNNGAGFTKPLTLGVRWEGAPRGYAWSNTFSF